MNVVPFRRVTTLNLSYICPSCLIKSRFPVVRAFEPQRSSTSLNSPAKATDEAHEVTEESSLRRLSESVKPLQDHQSLEYSTPELNKTKSLHIRKKPGPKKGGSTKPQSEGVRKKVLKGHGKTKQDTIGAGSKGTETTPEISRPPHKTATKKGKKPRSKADLGHGGNTAPSLKKKPAKQTVVFRRVLTDPASKDNQCPPAPDPKELIKGEKVTPAWDAPETIPHKIRTSFAKDAKIHTTRAGGLNLSPLEIAQPPVPNVSYGLERVLFNPGVYHLQDPRSRVYNFDPYLQTIMPVSEFDFNSLKEYVTSSRDKSLELLAKQHGKRYVGSTSSMTGVLMHFHFLLSQWREINIGMLSKGFPETLSTFTQLVRSPSAIFLKWQDGTYAIDADKEFASANILSMLGKSMEKLLTLDTSNYERYRKSSPNQVSMEERSAPESFHYTTMGDFLMRSQLDAYDSRLPGTGMFDLKTRAVVTIRMDADNYEQMRGYEIKNRFGQWESFEREYYDMIRSVFLKYSLQARMGRMDGIFVAYHNTERIFGFQYISLNEMDLALHGQTNLQLGDQEFKLSLDLLNKILDKATKKFPEQSIRLHFETRDATTPFMYIFAEPVTDAQMKDVQSRNNASVEDFERRVLGLDKSPMTETDSREWSDIQAKVQEVLDRDEAGADKITADEDSVIKLDKVAEEEGESLSGRGLNRDAKTRNNPSEEEGAVASVGKDVLTMKEKSFDVGDTESSAQSDAISTSSESTFRTDDQAGELPKNIDGVVDSTSNTVPTKESVGGAFVAADPDLGGTANSQVAASNPSSLVWEGGKAIGVSVSEALKRISQEVTLASDLDAAADDADLSEIDTNSPLLAMTLTLRNKVDGKYVQRPMNLDLNRRWEVEYTLDEVDRPARARTLYQMCQTRRKRKLEPEEPEDRMADFYVKKMIDLSTKGAAWRRSVNQETHGEDIVVLGSDPRDDAVVTGEENEETEEDEDKGREDDEDDDDEEDDDNDEEEEEEDDDDDDEGDDEEGEEEHEEDEEGVENEEDSIDGEDGDEKETAGEAEHGTKEDK